MSLIESKMTIFCTNFWTMPEILKTPDCFGSSLCPNFEDQRVPDVDYWSNQSYFQLWFFTVFLYFRSLFFTTGNIILTLLSIIPQSFNAKVAQTQRPNFEYLNNNYPDYLVISTEIGVKMHSRRSKFWNKDQILDLVQWFDL